jgi:outer membrane receptor protein involved in Fe transport
MYAVSTEVKRILRGVLGAGRWCVPACAFGSMPALAAEPLPAIDEIVVTATKRGDELLQDVPFSIRAVGERDLLYKDVTEYNDWARLVPGLATQDQGPGEKRFIIRGIQSVGPATVGVYFDEGVITGFNPEDDGGGRNAEIRLYDVERIEVLRGPQGTLYGEGSMSGTIRIVTNKPNLQEWQGAVALDGGSIRKGGETIHADGMLNIPVVKDRFALRAVAWYEDDDGFVDNVRLAAKDVNDAETTGGRLAARWSANEQLTVDLSAVLQRTEVGAKQRFFPTIGELQTDEFIVDRYQDDLDLFQIAFAYQLPGGSIQASSALLNRDVFFRFDSTPLLIFFGVPLPFALAVTDQPDEREIWSNEIRYSSDLDGPFDFVVGAFYQRSKRDFESNVISTDLNGVPTGTEADIFGRESGFDIDQYAAFGELTYQFNDRWSGLVGVRYFDYEQDSTSIETLPFGGFDPGESPTPDPNRSAGDSDVSVKASLSFKASESVNLYALYSEGFRQGGTNSTGFGNAIIIPEEFEPDSIKNYEIGAKSEWLDGRVVVNAAAYRIDWSNIQTQEQEPVQGFNFIGNAGAARVDGVEVELFAQPTPKFYVALAAGYQDARLTEDQPVLEVETPVGRDGDPIPSVPEFTGSVSAQFDFPVSGSWTGYVRGDWSYTGDSQTQFNQNGEFFNEQGAYDIADLRLGFENGPWRITLYAENLLDERAEVTIVENRAVPLSIFTNRPRTLGVKIRRQF